MIVKLYAYPTRNGERVPTWEALQMTGQTEGDGWSEHTPAPGAHVDPLEILALAFKWASEGQAVRVEFN